MVPVLAPLSCVVELSINIFVLFDVFVFQILGRTQPYLPAPLGSVRKTVRSSGALPLR